MTTKIKPIPDGYHTLSAYLLVRGAADALEFYKKAFGATEIMPAQYARRKNSPRRIQNWRFDLHDLG